MNLGLRVREIRISKGLKSKYVAKAIGYKSPSSYTEFEKGNRKLDPNKIPTLAKTLGIDIKELFFEENIRNSQISD